MEVRRITAQSEAMEDHYTRLAGNPRTSPNFAELGRRMLELVRLLPAIDGPLVWAVTSHHRLHLLAVDDFTSPSLAAIWGYGGGEGFTFAIEFPLPDGEAPWPGARMLFSTRDTWQACEMVAYGLSRATGVAYSCRKQAGPGDTADRGRDIGSGSS